MPKEDEATVLFTGLVRSEVLLLLQFRKLDREAQQSVVEYACALATGEVPPPTGWPPEGSRN